MRCRASTTTWCEWELASLPGLPLEQRSALARDPRPSIRETIARRSDLPKELVDLLKNDAAESVRVAARQANVMHRARTLEDEEVERAIRDPEPQVRIALLKNPLLTRAPLEKDPDAAVRLAWGATARTAAEMLRAIDALPDSELAEFLFANLRSNVVPAVTVAIAMRRNADANAVMEEILDLPPEAWRVMRYEQGPRRA